MNPAKLALLINDTFDAVERSKVGSIYIKDDKGNIVKSPEGGAWCNVAAMQVFQAVLSAQIIKGKYED